jgi:predicted ABC-type ATPase
MLGRIDALIEEGVDFAFETTLASKSFADLARRAQDRGYKVILLFFWLESPAMAMNRVAERVANGGHNIPAHVIERRYYRGIKNLHELYMPVCDEWLIVNNSDGPVIIADNRNGFRQILNQSIYNMLKEQISMAKEDPEFYLSDTHKRIMRGLRKAYNNLVIERAEKNETLVLFRDGKVQHVPAKELLHTIVQE